MTTIMLYGATGYSGRLIAEQAAQRSKAMRVLLAGRDEAALRRLGERLRLPWRAFALADAARLRHHIADCQVVLNAAGPFAYTAPALARACILAGVHYVDLCGEVDVYKALDDQGRDARLRKVALVCGAGYTALVSELMLRRALAACASALRAGPGLGEVRIVMSAPNDLSRGSTRVLMRALREQVVLVERDAQADPRADPKRVLRLVHVPVGRLQREFDFGPEAERNEAGAAAPRRRRIAAAANLVDTLVAKRCIEAQLDEAPRDEAPQLSPERIASYVEMDGLQRLTYQTGAWAAPWFGMPWVQLALDVTLRSLPDGPDAPAREVHRQRVLLELDDRFGAPLARWCLETPDAYEVTARCSLDVAGRLPASGLVGWCTPGAVFAKEAAPADNKWEWGCRLLAGRRP